MVPVYTTDQSAPLSVEAAVTEVIRPWYEGGQGRILCSVCLVHTSTTAPSQLMWLSRNEYINHWEMEPTSSMVVFNIFSASQLHVRLHLGHLAYVLALAGRLSGEENPRGTAVSNLALERFGIIEHDDVLKDFLGPASNEELDSMYSDLMDAPSDDAGASVLESMDSLLQTNSVQEEQSQQSQHPAGRFLAPKNNRKGR